MATFTLLAFQAAGALAQAPDQRLLHPVPPAACHASASEITVCGRDVDSYRLPVPGPSPEVSGPPKAEWGLAGQARMSVTSTQRTLGQASAPAAMVTIAVPF